MACQNAVLSRQRYEVRHGSQRHQIQVIPQLDAKGNRVIFGAQLFQQSVSKFEDQTHGAEMSPRPIATGFVHVHVRIDQHAIQRAFLGPVMIQHDHVDPFAP